MSIFVSNCVMYCYCLDQVFLENETLCLNEITCLNKGEINDALDVLITTCIT